MEHIYKGKAVFGGEYYEIAYGDQEYTHVALDKEEYEALLKYKRAYPAVKKQRDELEKERDDLVESYNQLVDDFDEQVKVVENSAGKIKQINQIKAETEAVRQTKQNIIELIRERANKERKIKDKKNDPGYVVKSSYHIEYRCGKSVTLMWKTTIQTPFFTEFSKDQFWEYFNNDEYRIEYFKRIGIGDFCNVNLASKSDIEAHSGEHFIDYYENKNFSTGFWEITLIHYEEVTL